MQQFPFIINRPLASYKIVWLFFTILFVLQNIVFDYGAMQPIAQKVNLFIKDTNHLLRKIKSLAQFPEGALLCAIDVVSLYSNISHVEGMASLRRFLDARVDKNVTTETLV